MLDEKGEPHVVAAMRSSRLHVCRGKVARSERAGLCDRHASHRIKSSFTHMAPLVAFLVISGACGGPKSTRMLSSTTIVIVLSHLVGRLPRHGFVLHYGYDVEGTFESMVGCDRTGACRSETRRIRRKSGSLPCAGIGPDGELDA